MAKNEFLDRPTGNDLLQTLAQKSANNETDTTPYNLEYDLKVASEKLPIDIDINAIQVAVRKNTGKHAIVQDVSPAESTDNQMGFAIIINKND